MSKHYDGYFIDLDGTIYQGTTQFPSGKRFIERLKQTDADYLFVTNNSTKTPDDVARNLTENHDIPTTPDRIYTSAMAIADYLTDLPDVKRILVIGEIGLQEALLAKGFELVDEAPADAVAIGLDRHITYEKLAQATLAIQQGAHFIATNIDTNLPSERGMLPGAGALIAALQTATHKTPIIVGKPETLIMQGALTRTKLTADQVIMVGDYYQTDIKAGLNAGIDTLLVYSGVSTKAEVQAKPVAERPTYEIDSLDDWQFN